MFLGFPDPLAILYYHGVFHHLELLTKAEAILRHGETFAQY